jgi:hypothetical protein
MFQGTCDNRVEFEFHQPFRVDEAGVIEIYASRHADSAVTGAGTTGLSLQLP